MMTLADQTAMTGQDGRVTEQQPGRPKRRTFTKAYKVRILAAFDALPEGSAERGALLRKDKLEARNEKLAGELGKTRTALDIAGKAFALLQDISSSADSDKS
jgi:hypothetical protein